MNKPFQEDLSEAESRFPCALRAHIPHSVYQAHIFTKRKKNDLHLKSSLNLSFLIPVILMAINKNLAVNKRVAKPLFSSQKQIGERSDGYFFKQGVGCRWLSGIANKRVLNILKISRVKCKDYTCGKIRDLWHKKSFYLSGSFRGPTRFSRHSSQTVHNCKLQNNWLSMYAPIYFLCMLQYPIG